LGDVSLASSDWWKQYKMFKNPKLLTLFFTMIVVMLGFGIIIPIMPFYVKHFGVG